MSSNSELKEMKSKDSQNSDELPSAREKPDQEQNSTKMTSDEDKSTELRNHEDLTETNLINDNRAESSQEKVEPKNTSQEKTDSAIPSQAQFSKSSQAEVDIPESSQADTSSNTPTDERQLPIAHNIKGTKSVRQIVNLSMTGYFDFNPQYLLQIRGLTNIMHIIISLVVIILLSLYCQLKPYAHSNPEGFYCKPPEMFLFIISCASFVTAVLFMFSCVLSKTSDILLFRTSFEASYLVMYFIMFLTASLTLIVSELNWGSDREVFMNESELSQIAAIIGLVNCIMYGISAIWFFINHRLGHQQSDAENQEVRRSNSTQEHV